MDNKISNIKERVLQIAKYKGVGYEKFFEEIGMSYGNFKGKAKNTPLNSDAIDNILTKFPEINSDWLISNIGEMLKNTDIEVKAESPVNSKKPHYEVTNYKPRPFIDAMYGALGVPNGFALAVKADECEQISIPFVNDYDFSIKGRGDSMINHKNPNRSIHDGDLVACKLWTSRSHIRWGEVYAIATSDGVVIKQIMPSDQDGFIKCVSYNEEDGFFPYELPVLEINDWALVVSVTHTTTW